jgi:hypothetical protein
MKYLTHRHHQRLEGENEPLFEIENTKMCRLEKSLKLKI